MLINVDEIKSNNLTYDLIVQRRKDLFYSINDENDHSSDNCKYCSNLVDKKFSDVNFDFLGGAHLPAGFNIQHYTACNQRCKYCTFTKQNFFVKPQYNILDYFKIFAEKGKIRGGNWVDFSGGEPSMLDNFDEIINYLLSINFGTIVVYSNCVKYSESIFRGLRENKIILTTSVDTGIPSLYKKLRGVDTFSRVISNLIKYRNSGTKGLWLKYIICEENRNEDSLWSFLLAMMALRPNNIMICPDFPYGDIEIPMETVEFAGELWALVESLLGITPIDYTSSFGAPKMVEYHKNLEVSIKKHREIVKKLNYNNINDNSSVINSDEYLKNEISEYKLKLDRYKDNINKLAWWIPIKKWRDNFRSKMLK
ncbi:Radical SAM domain protein [Brachyspira intermedia PWS/A]|uniref:Radical SAM domain protein n=1 Tax=Brachyspira intermedia (strain ATCC 51140 / PWS/A) TaxID=1045858 RepID=G0EQH3_BRAIP|nr:Radical SAM domain protein [Brachyspira intermedia PWS/A]